VRAFIVLVSAYVLLLATLIVRGSGGGPEKPVAFTAMRLVQDARPGETATYRDEQGETWTFKVEQSMRGGPDHPPRIRIWSTRRDRRGNPLPGGTQVYDHLPTRHGFMPLMAPADPDGYDRVWVWDRIRRGRISWRGQPRDLWRIDLIDPALPEAGGADHVVAWVDEDVPVFGLVRWQRRGQTWDLVEWSPR